jgi:hypothetical protein
MAKTTNFQSTKAAVREVLETVVLFWSSLAFFLHGGGYKKAPDWFQKLPSHAKVHLYSLSLIFEIWSQPHYRNGNFQEDMVKNLRNVAIPRTGIPLSSFCHSKLTTYAFVFVAYPIIALVAALHVVYVALKKDGHSFEVAVESGVEAFKEQLLTPRDWFSLWRLNCRLASYHSGKTKAEGYKMEDKWTFLVAAEKAGVPISPCMKVGEIVVKDRNEEGGMGIHFFKNACSGKGDWIIQEKLDNDDFVASMLPADAPLSTFRVITASRGGGLEHGPDNMVSALSCVFRAGRAGAKTDHSSIIFDIDNQTGVIGKGTTNSHWYQLGTKGLSTAWTSAKTITHHPDCDKQVTGRQVPIEEMKHLCVEAHRVLLPDVPMAGWDVALTNKGALLLETNLSCNFFRGTFDEDLYFNFVHEYFEMLDGKGDHAKALQQQIEASKKVYQETGNFFRVASRESCETTEVESSTSTCPTPSDSDSDEQQVNVVRRRA